MSEAQTGEWRKEFRHSHWQIERWKGAPSEEGTQALSVLCVCDTSSAADSILAALAQAATLKALEERAGLAAEMAEYLAKVAISNLYKVVFDVPWHLNWLARYNAIKEVGS